MSNNEVNTYLDNLEHPLKEEVLQLRDYIKTAFPTLTEIIKWNAPSYYYKEDMAAFNLSQQNFLQLIFRFKKFVVAGRGADGQPVMSGGGK